MIELTCETDFVAKTDKFRDSIVEVLETIHSNDNLEMTTKQMKD